MTDKPMPKLRNRRELPSRDILCSYLRYDPETGLLYWRSNGKIASPSGTIYLCINLNGKQYYAHRIIWKMEISEDVPHEIDHINEDKYDNRICNLRAATRGQNLCNQKLFKRNTSGYKGVSWYKKGKQWRTQIKINNKVVHLGYFDDPVIAHKAYVDAAIKYHGEFANDGNGPVSNGI